MAFGVTPTGFVEKNLDTILNEIEESEKTSFCQDINVLSTSVLGQLNGVMAGQLRELWEIALAVYRALYPDTATDASLDDVAAITGALRLAATHSTVNVHCTGTPTTSLIVGRVVSTSGGDRFTSTEAKTLTAATAWAPTTVYALGAIVTNNSNIYVCVQAGTSAGAGGPTTTDDNIVDNTCEWNFVGDGTGYAVVPFRAEETGAVACLTGAIDTEDGKGSIGTPVGGWEDARNLVDATVGREVETDAAFRLRREQLLQVAGAGTLDAIRADIIAVTGVIEAHIYENTTLVTDGDGVPGKAFESVVYASAIDADTAASVLSGNAEPFDLTDGDTITIKVDDGSGQTATFNTGDFADINAATAAEVAAVLNTDITGINASAVTTDGGKIHVEIKSDTTGASSSIEITGGTGTYTVLDFPESPIIVNGIDTKVAGQIWQSKPAGILAYGAFKIAVLDTQGDYHAVGLSNPTPKPIHVIVDVTVNGDYPSDGDDQVKASIVDFGVSLGIGTDVVTTQIYEHVFSVSGVVDITKLWISFTDPPTGSANLTISSREISTWASGDIDVTST